MDSRNNEQKQTAASTVTSAVKTGKAIANIAKGAARGGMPGAALAAAWSSRKWLLPVLALALIPIIIVAMLPSIIFAIIGAKIAGKQGSRKVMIDWTKTALD